MNGVQCTHTHCSFYLLLPASAAFHESHSSSIVAPTPVLHTLDAAIPMSLLGHSHSFPSRASPDDAAVHAHERHTGTTVCGINNALTEVVHAFGRTEEMSHALLVERMGQQPPAMFRRVSETRTGA